MKDMKSMNLQLDEDDYRSICAAIVAFQKDSHEAFGETMLPEGDSCFAGAIVAEICRAYIEYNQWFLSFWKAVDERRNRDDDSEEWKTK